jgi:hypothetical protein
MTFGKFKMEHVSSCFKEIQTINDSSGMYEYFGILFLGLETQGQKMNGK